MMQTPVSRVAGHDRALDGRRAAPARQQRRVHVDQLVVGQQRLADQRAERADDDDVGLRRGDPRARVVVVDVLGLVELDAELARRVGDRRRDEPAPAAAGRSGRVTTSCGRCGVAARRSSTSAANADVPRKTVRTATYATRAAAACSASRSARIAALRCSRVVRSRISTPSRWSISCWMTRASRPGRLDDELLAVLVAGADEHRDRPLDVDVDQSAGSGSPPR